MKNKTLRLLCFRPHFLIFILFVFLASGCKNSTPPSRPPGHPKPYKVLGKWYQPIPHAKDFSQDGIASWYGKKFHGRKTANGEIYDMYAMTAAHKTLPLGTYVRVQNKKNNKEVVVRVNDRGPFVQNRIIDLSYTAAKKLDAVGPGTIQVEVTALGAAGDPAKKTGIPDSFVPIDYYTGTFTFQVGAFKDKGNAERLVQKLNEKYKNAHISIFNSGPETFYRVRVGEYSSLQKIIKDEKILGDAGFQDAFIVAE
ncbi:MAG: septal ring lytic transglycosylase RlpA family protein [Deltaproteobacteria bacterium]|nr:septal ring lytic transglycosylase RlpA family protein [Deltaproteobacteria bacterium]